MNAEITYTENIFSYGTLRYEAVQLETFGHKLQGQPDSLLGYRLSSVEIRDPKVIATSGEAIHHILKYTGNNTDEVKGVVFTISSAELAKADAYEVADYKRISVQLLSGKQAWVYVSAEQVNRDC